MAGASDRSDTSSPTSTTRSSSPSSTARSASSSPATASDEKQVRNDVSLQLDYVPAPAHTLELSADYNPIREGPQSNRQNITVGGDWDWTVGEAWQTELGATWYGFRRDNDLPGFQENVDYNDYATEARVLRTVERGWFGESHVITVGNRFRFEHIDSSGNVLVGTGESSFETPDVTESAWLESPYLQDEILLTDSISTVLGTSIDVHDRYGADASPRLSLSWRPAHNYRLTGIVGRGYRAPDLLQLFSADYNNIAVTPSGILGYVILGNPNLDPETDLAFNLQFDFKPLPGLFGFLTLFQHDFDDLIAVSILCNPPSIPCPPDLPLPLPPLVLQYENVSKARTRGVELTVSAVPSEMSWWPLAAHRFRLDLSYALPRFGGSQRTARLRRRRAAVPPAQSLPARRDLRIRAPRHGAAGVGRVQRPQLRRAAQQHRRPGVLAVELQAQRAGRRRHSVGPPLAGGRRVRRRAHRLRRGQERLRREHRTSRTPGGQCRRRRGADVPGRSAIRAMRKDPLTTKPHTHETASEGRRAMFIIALLASLGLCASSDAAERARLITLGGDVTEIVFALGAGGDVVAVDTSSVYPPDAAALPKVGYQRQLAAEGLLALSPTLILASDEAGPPPVLVQLRDARVPIEIIAGDDSPEGAVAKVRRVASTLGRREAGEQLVADMQAAFARAAAERARAASSPRVLFVYARGPGTLFVAGRATSADAMIRLAGGRNAIDAFDGFKPLTAEAAVAAAPDVVLMLSRGLDSLGGADAVWAQPGLAQTPAARSRRLVVMDDLYLLGFGPRTGAAAADLARQLHPELATAQ